MKVIFKKALLSLIMISVVPTATHARQPLQAASAASLVKKACIVAGAVGAGFLLGKYYFQDKNWEEHAEVFFDAFLQDMMAGLGEDMGLVLEKDLAFRKGEIWACESTHSLDRFCWIIFPEDAVNVFYNGPSDKKFFEYIGSLAHELGHALSLKKNGYEYFSDKARAREAEEFADSCVPDDEEVLRATRDWYLDRFFNESFFNYYWFVDYIKKLDDETFVKDADRWYREHYSSKDVHPSNILRAKYFNDRLKALKEKQKKEQFVR